MNNNMTIRDKKFEAVVHAINPNYELISTKELSGGVSATTTALEVSQSNGENKKLLVRQHGERDLKNNYNIARDEFNLLKTLHEMGLPVQEPYFLDTSKKIFSQPYIVIEYVDGKTDFKPKELATYLSKLALNLAKIHKVDISKHDVSFLSKQEDNFSKIIDKTPAKLDKSLSEEKIRDVLKSVWPLNQKNEKVLLHGDFWPGNTLWQDGRLVAIIDWEDAALGDPLSDLANCRLEILWGFGMTAMEDFTKYYRSKNKVDFTNLPYWDLCAALKPCGKLSEWELEKKSKKAMIEKHKLFVSNAIEKID
jgi:aminoglycoside phosphotransferase (APT) family kinase protein